MIKNAMTVDVEDYYQVSAFEQEISRDDWSKWPSRVYENTSKILDLFAAHNIKGTFFTLAIVAKAHPELIQRIVAEGHELASHGMSHIRVFNQSPEAFFSDICESKAILEDIGGVSVKGYRAASYSVSKKTPWAHEKLSEAGYAYSSSVYPVKHDLYGIPDAPRFAYQPLTGHELVEVPITTTKLFGRNLPAGGGGFFRLFPLPLTKWMIQRINDRERESTLFYLHPWEIDPNQPRVDNIPLKTRVRHYLNLDKTYSRLDELLAAFEWGRMDEIFLKTS